MKKWIIGFAMLYMLTVPVSATSITAPEPPRDAESLLPDDRDSFSEDVWYVLRAGVQACLPDVSKTVGICASLLGTCLLLSLLRTYDGRSKPIVQLAGVIAIAGLLVENTGSMIQIGADTVTELSEYGKMLIPVMTAALASQGGGTSAAAIYTATALFDAVLSSGVATLLVPGIYIYLIISIVNAAAGDSILQKMRDFIKWALSWGLKLILYVFTGYISITGIISGTADQTAIKAAKLTFNGMIPVVGGIISDASETILIGASVVKNSVGIAGMLILLSIVIVPFLKIGVLYLLLKLTAAVCAMFCDKEIVVLIEDFSAAYGLLLAMTGTVALLFLISTVCFLKGIG